jgi:hypothetical protein
MKITEKLKNALRRKKPKHLNFKEKQVNTLKKPRFDRLKAKIGRLKPERESFTQYKQHAWVAGSFGIILLISFLVFRNFILTNDWPAGGDILGWISREYLYGNDLRWFHVWRPYSFGFVEIVNLLDFFLFAIHFVFQNGPATVKAFMFSSFVLAGVSVYAFAFRYTRKHVAALSASLVYLLNQWFASQLLEAHIEILFSYAVAPLVFLLLDKALETAKLKHILASAILLTVVVTAFHAECIVIYGTFLILFTIFYLIVPTKGGPFAKRFKRLLKVYAPLAIIVFLLSSFTLIPFLMNAQPHYYAASYTYSLDEAYTFGYKTLVDAFTLKSTEVWGYAKVADLTTQGFPGYPSIILTFTFALAYFCVLLIRRDRYTIFFAFSTLFAVIISMGPNPPFGEFFIWAWHNVPHFAVFRAVSRWILIAALAHAFFVALFVGFVVDYVEKKVRTSADKTFFSVETRSNKTSQPRVFFVSVDFINKIVKGFNKVLSNLGVLLLIFIFVSPALEGFYLLDEGLQVYTPQRSYLLPYIWVGSQSGDFRVVTVGQHPIDFGDGAMTTDLGWSHEIGVDSSFLTDKPTLQDGGWEPLSHSFVDYLRYRVVPYNLTADMMKMLGALNYRYVVVPSYASELLRQFFINQKNTHTVFNASGIVLENNFYSKRLIGTTNYVTILGDLDSFTSLYKIDSFNLNSTALLFVDQMSLPLTSNPWFTSSPAFISTDCNLTDLLMLTLRENPGVIKASQYGVNSFKSQAQWIQSSEWAKYGKYLIGEKTLQTSGKNSINIPFKVQSDGVYVFLARLGFTPYRGTLSIAIDGVEVREIKPITYGPSNLLWVNLGMLNLKGGNHAVTLSNDGIGPNDVDALAVINFDDFEQQKTSLSNLLENFHGRLVYLLEAENTFSYNSTSGWTYKLFPFNDFGLHLGEVGGNIALTGTASASSTFSDYFAPQYAVDDLITTRWASATGESHWFKIEWHAPQELTGVQMIFEDAKAKDYAIQTWNGTAWIDQIAVTDNNQTKLFHRFPQPANTTKLRINMNATAEYNMVSLWELKVFSRQSSMFSKIDLPRSSLYKLAFRLASGPSYGTVNVELDNFTASIPCENQTSGFNWYEIEPIFLEKGEHNIRVQGDGQVDFDTMAVFSVEENENVSLSDLFKSSAELPIIDYERIDSGRYNVHVKANIGFFLIFSDSYHPLWRAYVDSVEISPMIADYFVNCFFIDKTGEFDVILYFTGQAYTDLGFKISFITLLAVIVLFAIPSSVFYKIKSRLTKKRRIAT